MKCKDCGALIQAHQGSCFACDRRATHCTYCKHYTGTPKADAECKLGYNCNYERK